MSFAGRCERRGPYDERRYQPARTHRRDPEIAARPRDRPTTQHVTGRVRRRGGELHSLADSFETAVGNIIENVSSASTELENSAMVLTRSSAATSRCLVK